MTDLDFAIGDYAIDIAKVIVHLAHFTCLKVDLRPVLCKYADKVSGVGNVTLW